MIFMKQGLNYALITTLISGFSVYANAQLVKGIDPIVHTTIKNAFVGIMVLLWIVAARKINLLHKLTAVTWLKLVVVALVGGSLSFGLFFSGLKIIGAQEGALIHKTLVVWVTLLAIPVLKEKVSPWLMLASLGLYASNWIGGVSFKTLGLAHVMVIAATLLWSVETILVKRFLKDIDPDVLLVGRMGIGSGLLVAFMGITGKFELVSRLTTNQWVGMFIVSLFLFGYVMTWYRALQKATATSVSSILVGATVITTALTSISTGTVTLNTLLQSLAISGIVSMIVIFSLRSPKTKAESLRVSF